MKELNPLDSVRIPIEDDQVKDYHKWWDKCQSDWQNAHFAKRNIDYKGIRYVGCFPLSIGKWNIVLSYDKSEIIYD